MMFTCSVCWEPVSLPETPTGSGATGYAVTSEGEKVCYACCAVREEESMKQTGKAVLYLLRHERYSKDKRSFPSYYWEVQNWPGTLRFRCEIKKGRHNWAGSRIDAWFRGPDGKLWHGVNIGDNEILRCRATNR